MTASITTEPITTEPITTEPNTTEVGAAAPVAAPSDLTASVLRAVPRESSPFWFPGWRDTEAALLDAVFSARASYGGPTTGVRGVVATWRTHRQGRTDDLAAFAACDGDGLADLLGNRQRVPGNSTTKAAAVVAAAAALTEAGVRSAADVTDTEALRRAVVDVPGLGERTWLCFLGALGVVTDDAEAVVASFLREVTGATDDLDSAAVDDLLGVIAGELAVDVPTVRHALWRHQRVVTGRRSPAPPPVA
ncbi:hypothetical protein HQ602_16670 [Rhodococcus kroppenstedtii]|uniref:hypothetical protein n=1 Tax=Rhodococcoides kroppenstedtii TaxID=293050 RepID=UPI001C9B50D0|nr:hypothetical protein [Rhodococcus kroppenstedtii]MBY6438013.1 hypothetical protein [Rhodococcus kroppenstedtii]